MLHIIKKILSRLNRRSAKYRLGIMIGIAVCSALVLVFIGLAIYTGGGFSRFDLSRPGYEKQRDEITRPEGQKTYDTTGPIDKKAVTDFIQELDTRTKTLQGYGTFQDEILSDDELQITKSASP